MRIEKQLIHKKLATFPHSVGLVLPKFWCDLHELRSGDAIDVEVQLNRLIITIPDSPEKESQK
jgi:antitoxin component of MazEF toxin-antitoxin module